MAEIKNRGVVRLLHGPDTTVEVSFSMSLPTLTISEGKDDFILRLTPNQARTIADQLLVAGKTSQQVKDPAKSAKHTPLPWEVGGPYPSVSVIFCVEPPRYSYDNPDLGHYEAVCILDSRTEGEPNQRALADAALIVRAVNAHEDLLAALEAIVSTDPGGRPLAEVTTVTLARALAAIAKAKEGK